MSGASWVTRSLALVAAGGYLDRLAAIYPPPADTTRSLTLAQRNQIHESFAQGDDAGLLRTLLRLKKFPFNDPYIGFLRKNPSEIMHSPQTTSRICSALRSMGVEQVIEASEAPVQMNRRMGQMFRNWLLSRYVHVAGADAFRASAEPLVFLDASERELLNFANSRGCGLQKRPDFVARCSGRYVVGEAKFIGEVGGNQGRGFDDAITLAGRTATGAVMVAVIDGIVWLPNSGQMYNRLRNFGGNALTALLLDDFLASV